MLGILGILLISWALLFWIEGENLSVLGFRPLAKASVQLLLGFGFFCLIHLLMIGLDSLSFSIDWQLKADVGYESLGLAFWYHLKSVLTEELIFRGALLYIASKRLGLQAALLISAGAFGVYHWFAYGVWGTLVPMIYVFLLTASMGYVWAMAWARTRSIMLGLGLHLGWNFMGALFSQGPTAELLFVEQSRVALGEWFNLWYLLGTGLAVPLGLIYLLDRFWPRQTPLSQAKDTANDER